MTCPDETPAPPCRAAVTTWPSLTVTDGTALDVQWGEFFDRFNTAPRYRGDLSHPGWSAAIVEPCVRSDANVVGLSALVLDYDAGTPIPAALEHWQHLFGLLHTTRKHKPDAHRFRVILPFTRIVTPDEYETLWLWAEALATEAKHTIDPATKNVSRFWFMPGISASGTYEVHRLTGAPIDPDPILASAATPSVPPPAPVLPFRPTSRKYGPAALESACDRIRRAEKGKRNSTLNAEAYSIARLVASGAIDDAQARNDLRTAGLAAGLSEREVTATLGSAFSSGLRNPRDVPAPLRPVQNTGGTYRAATAAATAAAPDATPAAALFQRADHAELAIRTRARLESPATPLTYDNGAFWRYDPTSGIWQKLPDELVEHTVTEFAGQWIEAGDKYKPVNISAGACVGVARLIRNEIVKDPAHQTFAAPVPGVAFANGFVTVADGEVRVRPHSPDHLVRSGLPFDYDPLPHPHLDAFFEVLFGDATPEDRRDRVALIQEFIGASLLGIATRYQRCMLIYGTGGNGKSQLLTIAKSVFPKGTQTAISPSKWDERFTIVGLVGKLANFCDEMPDRDVLASELFKGVVTGNEVTGEYKNKDAFPFYPIAGQLFSANDLPHTSDFTDGFYRRWILVALSRKFDGADSGQREIEIGEAVVKAERQAIAAWAVEGAARLVRQRQYTMPASSIALAKQWALQSDNVALWASVATTADPTGHMRASEMHTSYSEWCKRRGFQPCALTTFGKRLTRAGYAPFESTGKSMYRIRILQNADMSD